MSFRKATWNNPIFGRFVSAKPGPVTAPVGQGTYVRLLEDATSGMGTDKLTLQPGHVIPEHDHPESDNTLVVVGGHGFFWVDGQWHEIQAGEVYYVRRGQRHAIRAADDCAVVVLTITNNHIDAGGTERSRFTEDSP